MILARWRTCLIVLLVFRIASMVKCYPESEVDEVDSAPKYESLLGKMIHIMIFQILIINLTILELKL